MGIFLAALDGTIVATVFGRIGTEFGRSNSGSWIATSYMLSTTAFQPLYGRFSDTFGRRTATLFALGVFLVGSALCGFATDLWSLVAARALAGIGGGGILTCASIIMTDIVPLRDRGMWQGYGNAIYASAAMIGAPLGGWLADTWSWRWAFWVNLPVGFFPLAVVALAIGNYNLVNDGCGWHEKVKRIDFAGVVSLVLGVTALVLALSLGGNEREWSDPVVYSSLFAGVILLLAFLAIEHWVATEPILPLRILFLRTPAACYWICMFSSVSALSIVFLIPLWFQVIQGQTAAESGVYLIPKIVASASGSILSGVLMKRSGKYVLLTRVSLLGMILSEVIMLTTWTSTTPDWQVLPVVAVDGFGYGVALTTTLTAMLSFLPAGEMGVGTAVSYLFRSVGSVLGIALSQGVLQALLKVELERRIGGEPGVIELARKNAASLREVIPQPFLGDVLGAYEVALKGAFAVCLLFAVVGYLGAFWMQEKGINEATSHVASNQVDSEHS
ncbi:major facilitator superfamily domain-containing protein [Chytriomyces sp. MP71]|nr:major facilitator superfamily domain-containing protein [Chytriomyces sp. MP71]